MTELSIERRALVFDDRECGQVRISMMHRPGADAPIVFLHGFGSTKEDFGDGAFHPLLSGHELFAWDSPGFGDSAASFPERIDIDALVRVAEEVLRISAIVRCHLVGHSMGGLTGLLIAERMGARVLSFTNIEGNLAPEDCFFSRQMTCTHDLDGAAFVRGLVERTWAEPKCGSAVFASRLQGRLDLRVVAPIFRSMVRYSDDGDLLQRFLKLTVPTQFMHGSQNDGLSYLTSIRASGVRVTRIAHCGHFPMYSNPVAMWRAIGGMVATPLCASTSQ